jgi:hypothetical protein
MLRLTSKRQTECKFKAGKKSTRTFQGLGQPRQENKKGTKVKVYCNKLQVVAKSQILLRVKSHVNAR